MRPFNRPLTRYDERDQAEFRRDLDGAMRALTPTTGKYTPVISSSGGGETVTYTTQIGYWWRIGDYVWFGAEIVLASLSGGSGDIRISLPIRPESNQTAPVVAALHQMAAGWTGAPNARVLPAQVAVLLKEYSGGSAAAAWSKLGSTGTIRLSGSYLAGT
jgi:hypothetical protein